MKRLLLSLVCGIVSVVGYVFLVAILLRVFKLSHETLLRLLIPLNIPRYIYENILGFHIGKPNSVNITIEIAAMVLTYSIPFYLAFTLYAKVMKKSKTKEIQLPPEPPIFEKNIKNKALE